MMAHILKTTTAGVLIATLIGIGSVQAIEFDVNGTKVKVYGYIKADLFGDLDTDLGTTTFGFSTLAPGFPRNKTSRAQAIQSRLGVITTTETQVGTVTTRLEGDFFGGGGGSFRLRHAYGEIGNWLIGQTWTNFMPIESYPGTLDFQGPSGIPFSRVTQLRYTHNFGTGFSASFSVEDDPAGAVDERPAITAAISYKFGESFVKLAAVSREINNGIGGKESGYGINLSGNTSLWQGGRLSASFTQGEGIGSYFVFGGADVDPLGNAIESMGFTIGLEQKITEKISFNLAYGLRDIDSGAATATSELETVHIGLNYNPVEKVTIGLEYFTGKRTQFNGATARADRIIASAKFSF